MMGVGHIDFRSLTDAVAAAGYEGDIEVEIFNAAIWEADPAEVVARTVQAFADHIPLAASRRPGW